MNRENERAVAGCVMILGMLCVAIAIGLVYGMPAGLLALAVIFISFGLVVA
jgi:hypothetical protein